MTRIYQHPFKDGIIQLLHHHFGDDIVKQFILRFETEAWSPKWNPNTWKQKKDNNLILEVHYRNPDETAEYICDVKSWWDRKFTEWHLLRHISDKVRVGKIGNDWQAVNGNITAGVYVTPQQDHLDTVGINEDTNESITRN